MTRSDGTDLLQILLFGRISAAFARRHGLVAISLDVAKPEGMRTLREAVAEKVLAGTTTAAEMLRVADT
jgi:hypothetical protein